MDISQKQKTLIEKLVGQEAVFFIKSKETRLRRLNKAEKKKKFRGRNISKEDSQKTKKEIYDSSENFNSESVKDYMLQFLDFQIKITRGINPSFSSLKYEILRGNYDFDFSKC